MMYQCFEINLRDEKKISDMLERKGGIVINILIRVERSIFLPDSRTKDDEHTCNSPEHV